MNAPVACKCAGCAMYGAFLKWTETHSRDSETGQLGCITDDDFIKGVMVAATRVAIQMPDPGSFWIAMMQGVRHAGLHHALRVIVDEVGGVTSESAESAGHTHH